MLTLHVAFAAFKKMTIFFCKIIEAGNRYKFVTTQVADLVFYVSLFPSGFGIHEYRLDSVMR